MPLPSEEPRQGRAADLHRADGLGDDAEESPPDSASAWATNRDARDLGERQAASLRLRKSWRRRALPVKAVAGNGACGDAAGDPVAADPHGADLRVGVLGVAAQVKARQDLPQNSTRPPTDKLPIATSDVGVGTNLPRAGDDSRVRRVADDAAPNPHRSEVVGDANGAVVDKCPIVLSVPATSEPPNKKRRSAWP